MFQPAAPPTAQPAGPAPRPPPRTGRYALDRIKSPRPARTQAVPPRRRPRPSKCSPAGSPSAAAGPKRLWGSLTNGYLIARLIPPKTANGRPHGDFELVAASASTRWGSTEKFKLLVEAAADPARTLNLINSSARAPGGPGSPPPGPGSANNAWLTAEWTHSLTNAIPLDGHVEMRLADPFTTWGQAGELVLEARLGAPPAGRPRQADASWAWWADLELLLSRLELPVASEVGYPGIPRSRKSPSAVPGARRY